MGRQRVEYKAMNDEERMDALESTLAHMEKKVEELSDIVAAQDRIMIALKRKLSDTYDKVETLEADARARGERSLSPGDIAKRDKPPHY